jgi:hypothetical protein
MLVIIRRERDGLGMSSNHNTNTVSTHLSVAKKVDGDRCAVLTFLPTQEEGSGKQQLSGWQNSPVQQGMLDLMSDVKKLAMQIRTRLADLADTQHQYGLAWLP